MGHNEAVIKPLFDEITSVIQGWIDDGKLAPVDPRHLITSIWATTQHYADFEAQTKVFLGQGDEVIDRGTTYLVDLFTKALRPD